MKKINKVELLTILIAIPILFIILNQNKIILQSPGSYAQTTEIRPEFLFSSNLDKYRIIIDDDLDFSTPNIDEIITTKKFIPEFGLGFGKYYWKVMGFDGNKVYQSKVSTFEVVSLVSTQLGLDTLRNTGNTKISVKEKISTPGGYSVVGFAVLDVGEFMSINQTKSEVVAQQT